MGGTLWICFRRFISETSNTAFSSATVLFTDASFLSGVTVLCCACFTFVDVTSAANIAEGVLCYRRVRTSQG